MSDVLTNNWEGCLNDAYDDEPYILSQEFGMDLTETPLDHSVEDVFDWSSMYDLLWDINSNEMKRSGLSLESVLLLASPENLKSKNIYERHQKRYLQWA